MQFICQTKLAVDFRMHAGLGHDMEGNVRDADASDLIPRLFALITAHLEDATMVAVDGQARSLDAEQVVALAGRLLSTSDAVETLSRAVLELVGRMD